MKSAVTDREKATFTTNGEYEQTRQETTSLLYIQEDEDFVRPTRHALDLTLNLLEDANAELIAHGTHFPRGTSSTSDKGGIYVFWEENGKSIQLEVPPRDGGMLYIHVISLDNSVMNRDVSANTLADALADVKLFSSQRLGTKNAPASAAAR
jgi:hypothetical protein